MTDTWCRFLDNAAVIQQRDFIADSNNQEERIPLKVSPWRLCSVTQVEEVKLLVRVMPIWVFSLMFIVHITQITSFFLRQGLSIDLSIGPNFKIPAASLSISNSLTVILCIPLYDVYFVPSCAELLETIEASPCSSALGQASASPPLQWWWQQ